MGGVWEKLIFFVSVAHLGISSFLGLIDLLRNNFVSLIFKVVEDGYEFFAKRQLVTLFSAPNYCGEFDNAGGMMSVDETLMCSFQVRTLQKIRENEKMKLSVLQFRGK